MYSHGFNADPQERASLDYEKTQSSRALFEIADTEMSEEVVTEGPQNVHIVKKQVSLW